MKKKFAPNAAFFKNDCQDNDPFGMGMGQAENVVLGADNFRPPPQRGQAPMNGNTQPPGQVSSKALIGAYKRAKQSGTFIMQSHGLTAFPQELPNFAEFTIPGENWWDGNELTKIDLSNNEIPEIPEDLGKQVTVAHLNVNTNKLQQIPNAVFAMPNLKFLDISNNNIKCLPEGLGQAQALCELKATGNQISQLPQSLGDLGMNLESLDLKGNGLRQLPDAQFGRLGRLMKLCLDENLLEYIPGCFVNLTNLVELSIAKNRLQDVQDDALAGLKNLVSLDLHQNQFELFYSVPQSKRLDSIMLAFNRIDKLQNIERAPNVSILDLHSNKLAELPEDICELRHLKTLKVSNNDLADLNPRLALLKELVRINIEGNPLKCIKTSIRAAGAEPLKKYLMNRLSDNEVAKEEIKAGMGSNVPGASAQYDAWDSFLREFVVGGTTLDVRNKNLDMISPKLWLQHPGLLVIDLSENPHLKALPEEFGNLVNLKQLRLHGCGLTALPKSLLGLKDLNSLELDRNQLSSFYDPSTPRHQVQLQSLSYLSLNGNQCTEVSPLLKYLPALRQLHMHQNKLTELTELCCKAFEKLEVVDVGQNKIREIPVALVHFLPGLIQLTLVNNDIDKLPNLLGFHKNIKFLTVEGNGLRTIRRPIIERGTDAILDHLKDKFVEGRDDIVEAWALERAKTQEDYSSQDYSYQKQNYGPQPGDQMQQPPQQMNQMQQQMQQPQQQQMQQMNQYQEPTQSHGNQFGQPPQQVGRLMNAEEYANAVGQRKPQGNDYVGNDPNQVQGQIQDYIANTVPTGYQPQQQQPRAHPSATSYDLFGPPVPAKQHQVAQHQQYFAPTQMQAQQDQGFHPQKGQQPAMHQQVHQVSQELNQMHVAPQQPVSQPQQQADPQALQHEILAVDQQINSLQNEIDNNFSLSRGQANEKKRTINHLRAQRAALTKQM